ncbi:hypothetical protein CAEBREN_02908 [Caenorhabditis brenneri]|uniref:Uncharacterized protein n=1 Tax=Caenorhabditis brenneri TaxID=135651 RepID=G0NKE2_CAEBE|nr:hypothetical protein CAEBREN_02908 [Caenorhabditis brenneri]
MTRRNSGLSSQQPIQQPSISPQSNHIPGARPSQHQQEDVSPQAPPSIHGTHPTPPNFPTPPNPQVFAPMPPNFYIPHHPMQQVQHFVYPQNQDFTFGSGNFAPLSPALSAMSLPIGVDQGVQQQAAGIGGFPQWPNIAQPSQLFGSLSPNQNGSAVVEKQSNRAKAPAKRGRLPKKEATEEDTPTRAAKKQKLPPQATEAFWRWRIHHIGKKDG